MEKSSNTKNIFSNAVTLNLKPLSRSQRQWLNLAVRAAESSDCRQQHGAVIVKSGSVLAIGMNKWRNRDVTIDSSHDSEDSSVENWMTEISVHAEIDALSRVKNPRGATIYIARVNSQGEERISAPCYSCAEALRNAGIHKVIYTTN